MRKIRSISVDAILLTAIAALLSVLLWPAVEKWQNRPRPGVQVCQKYLIHDGSGEEATATEVRYLLYLPSKYTTGGKWPLVVFLHGSGERGRDLELVRRGGPPKRVAQDDKLGFILLSPQCPANTGWSPELVVGLIEHISSSLSVDRDRVYLTGYSMGGFGTWATACYDPDRFAAIAPLCGGGDVAQAERLKNVPIWAFHGAKDKTVPLEASQQMVDAVRDCGGQVKLTIYPDAGHGICGMTYKTPKLLEWLLSQRRIRPEGTLTEDQVAY